MRLPRLYAIVDPLDTGRDPCALAAALVTGGARLLQVRLPDAAPRPLLDVVRAVVATARPRGATVLVNDRPDVARAAGAHGVHLGQSDVPVAVARAILGPDALIGLSTHDPAEAAAAAALGCDYIGVGPVYPTGSKPDALAPRGLALVRRVRATVAVPIVAIGGITPETAADVLAAGADAVAMIGALVRAADPAGAVADLLGRLATRPA